MIYGYTVLTGLDGTIRPLTPIPEHLRGRVWAVVEREPIDDLVDHLARAANPMIARWARSFRGGDR
jgi:hypothetical protein